MAAPHRDGRRQDPAAGSIPIPSPEDEPVDLNWLVEEREDPTTSAATSRHHLTFDQHMSLMPGLPELPTFQPRGSLPRPVSAESNFSAAASSPTALMPSQAGPSEAQPMFTPPPSRLITTGLRSRAEAAEAFAAQQDVAMDVQRSLRSQGAGESTTGTGRGNTPVAGSPRGRSRPPRSRSTASVKGEETQGEAGASPTAGEGGGGWSLRRRPHLNYAQAAGADSDSDASSGPQSDEQKKKDKASAEPKKSQRGRKRRTEPILVEKEDGTKEAVSPQDYRRLRRRVTNRLSARRMRQKRAEEREAVAKETTKLQQENNVLRARMVELEGANRSLAKEAYGWRMRYEQLSRGQPPQPPQPGAALQQGSAVYALPTPERRSHSLPAPQQQSQEETLQRSMSPGGFDAFTLTADFPSLQMMSPQTGQSPFPGRAQPSSQQQQPLPSLAAQGSFEGLDSQPGQTPGQQHQQQQVQSSRGLSSFYGLPPLQTGASPAGEIKTPPEREHARMSPVQSSARGGTPFRSHMQLRASPYTSPDLQRLHMTPPRGQDGPSILSPRHFSAPNLSQGGALEMYPSGRASAELSGGAFGQQGRLDTRASFGQHSPLELGAGGYGHLGMQQHGSYGQMSSPRGSHTFQRPALGVPFGEEELKHAAPPRSLQQQAQEAFGSHTAFGVSGIGRASPSARQQPPWPDPGTGS